MFLAMALVEFAQQQPKSFVSTTTGADVSEKGMEGVSSRRVPWCMEDVLEQRRGYQMDDLSRAQPVTVEAVSRRGETSRMEM